MIKMFSRLFELQGWLFLAGIIFPSLVFSNSNSNSNSVPILTVSEQAWIKDNSVIRLAVDIAWPPFEWINDNKEYQGIAADYMRLIESKLGIRFEVEKEKTWTEVVDAVKQHQLDVFSCVARNPQREEFVNFTRPYLSFPMVIITTSEVSYIDGVQDLKGSRVGVVKGYATHEYLAANHPEIELFIAETTEQGLEAISQGKIDSFVDNIATASHLIQKKGLTNLKISGEMPIRYELGLAVRKDWPELVGILQKALDSISDEQRKQIHSKWISVRYEHAFDYSLLWKTAIAFIFIIGLLYFYNRRLAGEISHRKLAEQAAKVSRDEAHKASRAKSEFLSVMSHELRTPLTSIKGALGLLSGGVIPDIPEQAQKLLRIASENSERLNVLVNDILDIEKLLAGKVVLVRQDVRVGALITKAARTNQGFADQYGVKLSVEQGLCDDREVNVDEGRLLQVLSNLLSNAVKYSPQNSEVLISALCVDAKVRFMVTDQGKGVPEAFHAQIFSRFSQADTSDTREKGGTGLGLAISKEIIESHGGVIGFQNNHNKGATFYFELPVILKGARIRKNKNQQ